MAALAEGRGVVVEAHRPRAPGSVPASLGVIVTSCGEVADLDPFADNVTDVRRFREGMRRHSHSDVSLPPVAPVKAKVCRPMSLVARTVSRMFGLLPLAEMGTKASLRVAMP